MDRRTRSRIAALTLAVAPPLCSSACFWDYDNGWDDPDTMQCTSDDDCSSDDPCFGPAHCNESFQCVSDFLQDEADCQCRVESDCEALGMKARGCSRVTCSLERRCSEEILPAGQAEDAMEGDCEDKTCDGVSPIPIVALNRDDVPEDDNTCTVDVCEGGPQNQALPDGTGCGAGVCFGGWCSPGCQPQDPDACGEEGPNEPANDRAETATPIDRFEAACGMLDGDDIDWLTFRFEDESPEPALIWAEVSSSHDNTEICMYARCDNGGSPGGDTPLGDCGTKIGGPLGTEGCCFSGSRYTLDPAWYLDCSGTNDDSATVLFSVRTPEGDACESYTLTPYTSF